MTRTHAAPTPESPPAVATRTERERLRTDCPAAAPAVGRRAVRVRRRRRRRTTPLEFRHAGSPGRRCPDSLRNAGQDAAKAKEAARIGADSAKRRKAREREARQRQQERAVRERTEPALVKEQFKEEVEQRTGEVAAGRAVHPCVVSTVVERADFAEPALDEPRSDPQHCLRNLRVVASRHPYDLGPVPPVVDFDPARFKIAADSAVVGPLDSRPGLLRMDPFAGDGFVASRALSRAKRNQPSSWGTGSASNQRSAACGSDGASRRIAVGRGSPEGSGARAAQARIAGSGSVSRSLPAQPDRLGRPLRIRRVRARRRDHLS